MDRYVQFNPFETNFQADPFASYRELLGAGPLHRTRLGVWIAVGYRECAAILGDTRFSRDHSSAPRWATRYDPKNKAVQSAAIAMLNLDGPSHERIRGAFSPLFTRRNILRFEQEIERSVLEHLDGRDLGREFDLVQDFALPVATDTIKATLGIGDCDSDIIRRFTSDSVIFLEPVNAKAEELETAERSYDELSRYIASVLERISTPDHALSNIRDAIEDGTLSIEEAISNIAFVLSAGIDTTVNLIGAGFYNISDKSISASDLYDERVVNELLRLSPSIHMTGRVASEDILLGDHLIKGGSMIIAIIAAANRDPRVFDNPDEIDPHRRSLASLSFGAGRHFCIGVHLAKLEAQIAWRHLARRLPFRDIEVTETEYERRAFIRTPRRMIVRQTTWRQGA
jgi:cytochrome P450